MRLRRLVLGPYWTCSIFLTFLVVVESSNAFGYTDYKNTFGYVDYNDECEFLDLADPATFVSHLDPRKYCDTKRGLTCIPGLGRCGCIVPLTIYRGGKCRARVSSGCIVKEYKLDCVEHAICTKNDSSLTFRCMCEKGYISNAEQTACFSRSDWDYRRKNWYYDRDGYPYRNYYGSGSYYYGNGRCKLPHFSLIFATSITLILVSIRSSILFT